MPAIISEKPRKVVPTITVKEAHVDERTALVERTKQKLGDKARGMHFFYGDKNIAATGRYEDEGYVAVEVDGAQPHHRGDPLFMRPDGMHKAHLEEAASESIAIKQATKRAENDKYKTRTADGSVIGPEVEE